MSEKEEKRKIIEIYVTENEKENTISFDIEATEKTEVATNTMKMLLKMFSSFKDDDDIIEVEYK